VPFGGAVWVVSQQAGYVARLVPGNPRPTDRVSVGHQPRQITAGGGRLWVSVFGDNSVVEVDPRARRVLARIPACQGPQGLAYAAGRLWVGCTNGNQLAAIDPASRRVVRRVHYAAADAVTRTGAFLLITSDNGPALARLDPRTGMLADQVRLSDIFIGDANADVVAAGTGYWVSSPDEGTVYRVPIR
jgi:streptogramin lyase